MLTIQEAVRCPADRRGTRNWNSLRPDAIPVIKIPWRNIYGDDARALPRLMC